MAAAPSRSYGNPHRDAHERKAGDFNANADGYALRIPDSPSLPDFCGSSGADIDNGSQPEPDVDCRRGPHSDSHAHSTCASFWGGVDIWTLGNAHGPGASHASARHAHSTHGSDGYTLTHSTRGSRNARVPLADLDGYRVA